MSHYCSGVLRGWLAALLTLTLVTAWAGSGRELRQAAQQGDTQRVALLIKQGANVNAAGKGGGTPLIKAAKGGHMAVAQILLFHGADPRKTNKHGRSAIDLAEKFLHHEIAEVMRDGIAEQAVTLESHKVLTREAFNEIMASVFEGRKWKVEQRDSDKLVGQHDRKGRAYRVQAMLTGQTIVLKFQRGYGARKTGYLENLKKDLVSRL